LGPQLQRLENPFSINALNALRDGTSCSDTMGCGGYVGPGARDVKTHVRPLIDLGLTEDLKARPYDFSGCAVADAFHPAAFMIL